MTREEALIQLRLGPGINEDVSEEYNEAVDMAIKALQQQPSENEKIIRISKGTLKARTGKYVIYDVEWLKTHFNTTEAKIYGQPQPEKRTEERTEMHVCDCISRQAVINSLHSYFADGFDSDKWWNSTHVLNAINKVPSITPQPKEEPQQKTGHWIGADGATVYVNSEGNVTESRDKGEAVKCSECGEWLVGSDEYVCGGRYCPSCGIKMEVKK